MLKIRLERVGRVHEPVFRLVLTDSKNSTKSGKSIEILGNYDARRGEKSTFKTERISYWISQGAKASPTVHNLLVEKKVVSGKKVNKLPLKVAIKKEEPAQSEALAVSPKAEEQVAETPAVESVEEKSEPLESVVSEEKVA